jgi:peptidyl-Lys metalloendopeptidase
MFAMTAAVAVAGCGIDAPADVEAPIEPVDEVDEPAVVRSALAHHGARLAATDRVEVTFTLENPSDQPIDLLRWGTPLDAGSSNAFVVDRDGASIAYTGLLVLRGAPSPADYVHLEPGESRRWTVDIGDLYAFEDAGRYRVSLRSAALRARSAAIEIELVEPRALARRVRDARSAVRTAAAANRFHGCSTARRSQLAAARTAARGLADESWDALLRSTSPRPPRYEEWFGPLTSARYDHVRSAFRAISDALQAEDFDFHCGDLVCDLNPSYIAFVRGFHAYHVYLCPQFWDLPATGPLSRGGAVLHEVSHFDAVADTRDHAYGDAECAGLALASPNQAMENADSYRLFAENIPFLSMGDPAPPPPRCGSAEDCTNGQFCIQSTCRNGPISCDDHRDCGPGALCPARALSSPGPTMSLAPCLGDGCPPPPPPPPGRRCVLY